MCIVSKVFEAVVEYSVVEPFDTLCVITVVLVSVVTFFTWESGK